MTRPTNLADMAYREAERGRLEGLRMLNGTAREAEYRAWWEANRTKLTTPDTSRLALELRLSGMLAGAFKELREALAPTLDAAERYETARTLYQFFDGYDGGDERNPINALPYFVAEAAARYLMAGRLDSSQGWWDSYRSDNRMRPIAQLAWLREQLIEAAESRPLNDAVADAMTRAAAMLSCEQCGGEGFQSAPDYEGQQHAVESQCELCGGNGARS